MRTDELMTLLHKDALQNVAAMAAEITYKLEQHENLQRKQVIMTGKTAVRKGGISIKYEVDVGLLYHLERIYRTAILVTGPLEVMTGPASPTWWLTAGPSLSSPAVPALAVRILIKTSLQYFNLSTSF